MKLTIRLDNVEHTYMRKIHASFIFLTIEEK